MFRSATLRLTLWYLAIVMAISLLFSGILYHETTRTLQRGLTSESQTIFNQYPVFQNDPDLNLGPGQYYRSGSHRILVRLVGFNIIVLVFAGFSSYFFAKRTLGPIEAAHEQQKRFTADVSHELRTPLTAIKMESEVALMDNKSNTRALRATIKSNLEEVDKLEHLINSTLKLSRLENEQLKQTFTAVNADDVFNAAAAKLTARTKHHPIDIKSDSQAAILGDQDSLEQLIIILLDNAVKYSPADSRISVSAKVLPDSIHWTVEDHGYGIDPAALQHIFDRFYRSDSSRTTEGYGLGLSLAKMITDLHRGVITISSQVGKGTTVDLKFPKLKVSKSTPAA